ncbi:MAG: glutamine-hydrolyzing GMP synthase [Bdellovibrionaceae bacterium]|nr:glutamine-hydrolyzing GMP synthase [Bdellovibrio sp.]
MKNGFLILDFGSQVTMLIARRLRDLGFYSEIKPYNEPLSKIKEFNPDAIILSGGPNSVYDEKSPKRDLKELLGVAPLLGICYGMQLLSDQLGGKVKPGDSREYGLTQVSWNSEIHKAMKMPWPAQHKIWMSHGDVVDAVPKGAKEFLRSDLHIAGFISEGPEKFMALQYHPEVSHSEYGTEFLKYFAEWVGAKATWKNKQILHAAEEMVRATVGETSHVLCALSGGVDSSVVATLLTKILGPERVHCVFVNNGLLRYNEFDSVMKAYKQYGLNVVGIDAEEQFLAALKGISEPELKRKKIGGLFIDVFDNALNNHLKEYKDKIHFLAQGTLYPDVIESVSSLGGSVTIKSHHNVGGLPAKMNLKLVEPVRNLFKDEVRRLGEELGLTHDFISRHPFPGPGLGIRIISDITREKLEVLKKADHIFIQALRDEGLYHKIWQAFCVLLPVQTVGVMGDGRTYENVLALRAVTSVDGMTADWYEFETSFLKKVSNQITNQVRGINRVVYDITSKPPATIEWE